MINTVIKHTHHRLWFLSSQLLRHDYGITPLTRVVAVNAAKYKFLFQMYNRTCQNSVCTVQNNHKLRVLPFQCQCVLNHMADYWYDYGNTYWKCCAWNPGTLIQLKRITYSILWNNFMQMSGISKNWSDHGHCASFSCRPGMFRFPSNIHFWYRSNSYVCWSDTFAQLHIKRHKSTSLPSISIH